MLLLGTGVCSDGYHMSSPPPDGRRGAGMRRRWRGRSGPAAIDYVNLHGTATPRNDGAEALRRARCSARDPP